MSDEVLATDPEAAAELVAGLRAAAGRIGGTPVGGPGGDGVFGAAAASIAAVPAADARWRAACADVLVALAAGTALASAGTETADRW